MKLGNINLRPFVMTVPEYPEKTVFIQNHLKSIGIEAEEFPCLLGIDPKTKEPGCGLTTLHPYEYDAPGSGWNIGPKSVSLLVSFQMFWCAAQYMPEDYFLFLEWDCRFAPDWKERTEKALADCPPDFDFLFLGSCCCGDVPKTRVKGSVWEVKYPMCNHAQIIAKKAMPTLLRTQRKFYAPADISLAFWAFPHLKVYTILPRVADQFNTEIPE
jgi:hypothetical protein